MHVYSYNCHNKLLYSVFEALLRPEWALTGIEANCTALAVEPYWVGTVSRRANRLLALRDGGLLREEREMQEE